MRVQCRRESVLAIQSPSNNTKANTEEIFPFENFRKRYLELDIIIHSTKFYKSWYCYNSNIGLGLASDMIETKAKYCLNNNHSIFPCSFSPAMVRIDMSRFSGEKYDNWHKLSNFNIFLPSWMTRPRPLSATIKPGTKNSAAAESNNGAVTHVSNVWQSLKTTNMLQNISPAKADTYIFRCGSISRSIFLSNVM